jgi:uroporphyrinogen-III decarboxylase
MSFERFLALTATEPDLVADLTEVCRQRIVDVLEALLAQPGIELVWIGGSEWVTPPMAAPATYDVLVQEQEHSLIEYAHAQSDALVQVHCHGRVRHALQRTIERGADYTEPCEPPPLGDIWLAEAKALAARRITLGGNIECRILAARSEDAVEAAVRAAFEGGKERFVLRPTEGPSPAMTEREFENYVRLVDVWEELSPI